ncbi:MAG: hypothetical protein JXA90_08635 [Planctomycetes bacterium]|nr:hypothetical protein [Planctomycetota bacterium]
MAQREGSLYLTLFIVAMLLFILSTVAFFVAYNRREEMSRKYEEVQRTVKEQEAINQRHVAEINGLKTLIAGSTDPAALGREEEDRENFKNRELIGVCQAAISEAKKYLGQEPASFKYLTEPYSQIKAVFNDLIELRDAAVRERDQMQAFFDDQKKSYEQTIADLRKQLDDKQAELVDAQQKYEDCEGRYGAEKEKWGREKADLQDIITDMEIDTTRMKNRYDNRIDTLQAQNEALRKKERASRMFEELEPDGRLQKVVTELRKGWIDLGRQDHLMAGLIFQVYTTVKGGKKVHKGRVEVRRVDEKSAEVRILEEDDPLNPISDGDYIASPFYDKAETPIFVFAGQDLQDRNITREFLEAKLKSYGVELRKAVDVNTSFVVALEDYQQTTEYKMAEQLSIPLLREIDVLEFIGY